MSLRPPVFKHRPIQCLSLRNLTTTTRRLSPKSTTKEKLLASQANIPPYPYGPALWYKQSNFGLYGGQTIRFGNNVSEKTETKTRRKWRPNVQHKRLYSVALGEYIQIKVTTRVLRTIDKCGGLDEYLVGRKPARVKELGMKGWALRFKVQQTDWWRAKMRANREELRSNPVMQEEERRLRELSQSEHVPTERSERASDEKATEAESVSLKKSDAIEHVKKNSGRALTKQKDKSDAMEPRKKISGRASVRKEEGAQTTAWVRNLAQSGRDREVEEERSKSWWGSILNLPRLWQRRKSGRK